MNLPKVVIVHIPKTGGNSLIHAFESLYPQAGRAPFIMGNERPEPAALRPYSFIAGHFGYDYAKQLGGHMVTVLREPVSRVLSFYNFWKTFPPGTLENEAVQGRTLREYLESDHPSVMTVVRNAQAWQIAHDNLHASRRQLKDLSDEDLLGLARERLSEFAVVGITEDLAGLARRMESLGIALPNIGVHNATRYQAEEADEATLNLLREMAAVDVALYDTVKAGEARSS